MQLLVKCYDNKMVKLPGCYSIGLHAASKQKKRHNILWVSLPQFCVKKNWVLSSSPRTRIKQVLWAARQAKWSSSSVLEKPG